MRPSTTYGERNHRKFVGKSLRADMIIENIMFEVQTRVRGLQAYLDNTPLQQHVVANWELDTRDRNQDQKTCRWLKPPMHGWVFSCDGSLNQIRASYCGLLRDHIGSPIVACRRETSVQHSVDRSICFTKGPLLAIAKGCSQVCRGCAEGYPWTLKLSWMC